MSILTYIVSDSKFVVMLMIPNPGGQLAPDHIVGREEIILKMWSILAGRCIYMNDLRRVGKTMILEKMKASPPAGWLTIRRDLGGCHTAAEFATQTYRDAEGALSGRTRAWRRMKQLPGALKGIEIAGVLKLPDGAPAPWKEVLTRTFADLNDEMTTANQRVVLLWDEVPFLLQNVTQHESSKVAMEILDVLRALSQEHDRVRLLLTGSVGLHHVLASLRSEGYINSPLNHMEYIAPGPLIPDEGRRLALSLLKGAKLKCQDPQACAAAVAEACGNVPFYIHKLVSRLPAHQPVDPNLITATLKREIMHADNDWDLAHYRTRLPIYYGPDENLALLVLDALAASEISLAFEALRRQLSGQTDTSDPDRLRGLLKRLQQDHYLERDGDGLYAFRFALIRSWWRYERIL